MKQYKIKIKGKVFSAALVDSEDDMKKGLSGTQSLNKGKGMLFDIKGDKEVTMNMKGMMYPIDMVFISKSLKVIGVQSMEIGGTEASAKDVMYVLEVNKGEAEDFDDQKVFFSKDLAVKLGYDLDDKGNLKSHDRDFETENNDPGKGFVDKGDGEQKKEDKEKCEECEEEDEEKGKNVNIIINLASAKIASNIRKLKAGGSIEIYEDEVKAEQDKLQVLDDKGKVLMNIKGGERIFSIVHTEELIDLAKRVEQGEVDPAVLGQKMKEIIKIQNEQKQEYTDY